VFLSQYPSAPVPDPNTQLVFDSSGGFLNFNNVDYLNQDFRTGRTSQYSLDIQHQLTQNLAFTLGYTGSEGSRLRSNFQHLDALPLGDLRLGFPILNESLGTALADPATVAYANIVGVPLPDPTTIFPGCPVKCFDPGQSVAQALRPFPQYRDFQNLMESRGHSTYNALNARLDWRYHHGLQMGASYTWSKLITDAATDVQGGSPLAGSYQNPFDPRQLRSVDPTIAAHAFVINYIYELPFGAGRHFLNMHGPVDKIVGGWEVAVIQNYRSGLPLVPTVGTPNSDWLNLVGYDGNLRPNLTGEPILTGKSPNGISYQAVNPAAFTKPPDFTAAPGAIGSAAYAAYYANPNAFFGTAPPVLSQARLFPYKSEDITLLKKTNLNERFALETRAVFLNAFNRHRYFLPDMNLNSGSFGQPGVVGDQAVYGPRVIQLAMRLLF
jgi:hypothetical protein